MAEKHYLGNPLLKKANTEVGLTEEQIVELGRCAVDPVYFARNYVKIVTLDHGLQPFKMYPFQEKMIQAFQDNRFNIVLCSRQAGKSTTAVSFLLHYAIFNDNINIAILANKANTARDLLGRLQTGYENLPKWLQQGILSWNKGSLELENGSKIFAASTSASSVRGGSYNIIFLDEFAFVPSQVADNFMSSVYPTITSGKDSKVIVVSCVTKDTYLLTDKGYRKIENLIDKNKTGAYIVPEYTVRGNDKFYSSNIIVNQPKSPTNIIKTCYETIECSENHFLWAYKDGKYDYFKSKDLSVGDYVAIKYNQQIFGDDDYVGPNLKWEYVTEDAAAFVASYVTLVSFKTYDEERKKWIEQFFKALGIDTTRKWEDKCLSDKVLCWSKKNLLTLLSELFTHNGSIEKEQITFQFPSKEFARQVQLLLSNLGIFAELSENGPLILIYDREPHYWYKISIKGRNAKKFLETIKVSEFKFKYAKEFVEIEQFVDVETDEVIYGNPNSFNSEDTGDFVWVKIKEIEKSENEVFDVSLPDIEGDKWAHSVLYNNFLGHQTPFGMNHFHKLWDDAIKGNNKYIPLRVYWQDIPGRDEKFKADTIANIGQTKWDAEFECEFLGSSDTLINGRSLANLIIEQPIRSQDLLDVYEEPIPGKRYVVTVDVAEGVELDFSAFVVFDASQIPFKVVAKYRNNDIPALRLPDVVEPVARAYNDAFVLCEINNDAHVAYLLHTEFGYPNVLQTKTLGRGGQVAGQNFAGKGVKYGIKMSKPVKRIGCMNLKTLIEEQKLLFNDRDIIEELTTFVSRYNSFSAEEGKNDDLTICLVLFAWLTTQEYFKEMTETDLRKQIREEHEMEIEDNDSTPFGFINSSMMNSDVEADADGTLWFKSEDDFSFFWEYNL